MNYAGIEKVSFVNGDGCRTVLFLTGCNHYCKGCHNASLQNPEYGERFTDETETELWDSIDRPMIDGLTLSGGDPMFPPNRSAVHKLCRGFRKRYGSTKTIWMYTGYTLEEIRGDPVLEYVDVLVDGRYIEELKTDKIPFVGSSNQKIWRFNHAENDLYTGKRTL